MAMPAYVKFLKPPVRLSTGTQTKDTDTGSGDAKVEEEDHYDKIMVDHFNPAFLAPRIVVSVPPMI